MAEGRRINYSLDEEHGTWSAYNGGCRCDPCKELYRDAVAARRKRAKEQASS